MGSDEDPKEYDKLRLIFRKLLIVGNVFGLSMIFLMLVWALKYGGGFDWNDKIGSVNIHILIMLTFMLYLHGHAAIIYRVLPNMPKYGVKLMHASIHFIVCIGIAVGLAAAVQSHYLKNAEHFYSLHSWLGISAIGIYYLQFLGGFICFLLPMTPMSIRNTAMPFHKFAGQSVFTLATGAAVTGVMLKAIGSLGIEYPKLPAPAMALNFAGFLVLLFAIIIGVLMSDHRFRRRPRPEGELLLTKTGGGILGGGDGDTSDHAD